MRVSTGCWSVLMRPGLYAYTLPISRIEKLWFSNGTLLPSAFSTIRNQRRCNPKATVGVGDTKGVLKISSEPRLDRDQHWQLESKCECFQVYRSCFHTTEVSATFICGCPAVDFSPTDANGEWAMAVSLTSFSQFRIRSTRTVEI